MSLYSRRGVSAQKEDVHAATEKLDKGLFPFAFCKIYPDLLTGDSNWVNIMHADGAGTKSILAYLYWKETGDLSVWKGIARDAIVMNLDDMLCAGVHHNFLFSSTIDRNKKRIPGEVLETIINGTREFFEWISGYGIGIHFLGGETADVGDLVRTITVNGTMVARWPKSKIVTNEKIAAGDVIVGLSSFGQSNYESEYNSGIASNGLTSARHDMLHKLYGEQYPETFDDLLDQSVVYSGSRRLTDEISIENAGTSQSITIGKLLLSPTRSYAPVLKTIFENYFDSVHGLVHCTGGGQTKCLKYIPEKVKVIKDQLFDPPEVFKLIQDASHADDREMYQVFNMGTRLEIYTGENDASRLIAICKDYGVEARIIGRVEAASSRSLQLYTKEGLIEF